MAAWIERNHGKNALIYINFHSFLLYAPLKIHPKSTRQIRNREMIVVAIAVFNQIPLKIC